MMSVNANPRLESLVNTDWKFIHGDLPEAMKADFDDSGWYDVCIPHSFGTPYFMENHFYVGEGVYRKTLSLDPDWMNRRITLEFQGVFQEAEVWLNGICVCHHQGGYTAFEADLTAAAVPGDNILFVRVNNRWNPQLAPRAGEHVFQGGIYRDVLLRVTAPLHVAWYGTWVKTPEVSREAAVVEVDTEIVNHRPEPCVCTLESRILREGVMVAQWHTVAEIAARDTQTVTRQIRILSPDLWHPETPSLYVLQTRLWCGDVCTDITDTAFGIRWFHFSAAEGFFLNGSHLDILGANVHQDHAGWGDAVTHAGIYRDVKMIRDCGMNFIRGSHYPHHTVFSRACDETGMLFWQELCFWGIGGFGGEGYWNCSAYPVHEEDQVPFEESCLRALREMIRTHRNHPSVIVWSMCNEVFFSAPEVLDKCRNLIRRLVAETHRLDPTRPAAVGGAQRGGFDVLGDIAGYNGDGASIFINPGFPNFVSEYGSTISDRPGSFDPSFTDNVDTFYPWRSGKAIWCGFHHGSICDRMGHMGMVDYYRLPLRSWYWYRWNLTGIPAPEETGHGVPVRLRLTSDRTSLRADGTEDAHLVAEILDEKGSRTDVPVTIRMTVVSGAGALPTGRTMTFSVQNGHLADGAGAIEMRAMAGGGICVCVEADGLKGDMLTLQATGRETEAEKIWRLQTEAPAPLVPGKQSGTRNIAGNKPVFSSSSAAEHSAQHVNDGEMETFWKPAQAANPSWVMLDLEGCKKISGISVSLTGHAALTVSVSLDGKVFSDIYQGLAGPALELPGHMELRYLRLAFEEAAPGVSGMMVWSRD